MRRFRVPLGGFLLIEEEKMNQSYPRDYETRGRHPPVYREAADIPLERDIEHDYRASQFQPHERGRRGSQGYDTSSLGWLGLALGAGALVTWLGTRSGSQNQSGSTSGGARHQQSIARDETDDLIASNKVEGTAVYDRHGEKIGTVDNFMVGKRSGRVAYAVVSFGGFLGVGGGYHALPWNALTYNEKQGGYVVPTDRERLRNAPSYQAGEDPFSNPAYGRQVSEYWLVLR